MKKELSCILCQSLDVKLLEKDFQSYIEDIKYDIYKCQNCNTHFIEVPNDLKKLYNRIYSESENIDGYDRYYEYANTVKSKKNPLQFLAITEPTYLPIYDFLKTQSKKLKILEIGSGFGYTTYSMRKLGHEATGIDISDVAVEFANKTLGNHYLCSGINEFKTDEKYDLIISTEVIEHLSNPDSFIDKCLSLLNKSYADIVNPSLVWQTDLPPVHLYWGTKKGFSLLAQRHSLNIEFKDMTLATQAGVNNLFDYFELKNSKRDFFSFNDSEKKQFRLYSILKNIIIRKPFRLPSALILNKLLGLNEHYTMAFTLTKIKE